MIKKGYGLGLLLGMLILSLSCGKNKVEPTVYQVELSNGWRYKKATDSTWSNATVPGSVHTDLLNDGVIDDPFYRLNERGQQWIGETDWEYETTFEVTDEIIGQQNIKLVFEGLDTYADVYLNDVKILDADNMFRTWEVNVKSNLIEGENKLRVYFHNVFKVNGPKYDNADYRLQAFRNNDQADIKLNLYSRKAGFHYGWDWGPRLVTAGIWRPVTLEGWSDFKIDNVFYRQQSVTAERAEILAEFEVSATQETTAEIVITHEGTPMVTKEVSLKPGQNKFALPMTIEKPELWWTNGLGEQPLYTFETTLKSKEGLTDKISERIGIRSLEVVRKDDQFGKSLYVKLNGVPVFMKGANYIPQDNFQNRVTEERYEHILGSAKAANMNMIRVWGGGIYEEDIFYDLCDEKGLLVWQDIMFACGMYPSDDDFLDNVANEVVDNVTRLRNHASIALFCGNNENEISWYSWGWKDKYDENVQKQYEKDLKRLFYETIPNAILEAHPDIYYHPSSPIAGIGDDRPKEDGDTHYWGVWHGQEPFENFENNVSRFVSEYGFQSYPQFESIKKFTIEEDRHLESEVMRSHQRCMADEGKDLDYGNRLINTYLERNFKQPKDFENYIYVVQALQAKGVKKAVETHRRNKTDNYCMGTMYWQINDCWPAASWSSIDYYGKWKALHYQVKKAYQQVLVTSLERDDKLEIHIISDELTPLKKAALKIRSMDFEGNEIWSRREEVTVAPNTSQQYLSIDKKQLLGDLNTKSTYVELSVEHEGALLSQNNHFFENEVDLSLPKAQLTYEIQKVTENGYTLNITTDKFARYVFISCDEDGFFPTDNYFDLDAGETKAIEISTEIPEDEIENRIQLKSLSDTY